MKQSCLDEKIKNIISPTVEKTVGLLNSLNWSFKKL
jgi:hypothetical protein